MKGHNDYRRAEMVALLDLTRKEIKMRERKRHSAGQTSKSSGGHTLSKTTET